jgi:hypothetical protein
MPMPEENATDGTESFVVTSTDAPAPTEVKEVEAIAPESTETETVIEETKTEPVSEVEGVEAPGEDTPADQSDSKKKNGVQKRIDKVTRQREEEKRKVEALQKKLDEYENKAAEPKAPNEDDYEDYEKFLDAEETYKEVKANPKVTKADENTQTDSQKTAQAIVEERYLAAENKPKDFDAVAFSEEVNCLITAEMVEAMSECENTTDIMYQLGKDIPLAKSINAMSPTQQMMAIAKLDNKQSKPSKPVKTSKAAQPISPGKGADTPTKKSLQDQSFSEFAKTRDKQEAKRKHW